MTAEGAEVKSNGGGGEVVLTELSRFETGGRGLDGGRFLWSGIRLSPE